MLEHVSHNYMDCNLSLSTVAEELSLTPSYVTRYFKNKNGLPLMQYVSKIRIEKAKELLETTNLTIKEIVEQVGFVDENNFSRAFRKREGVSPSQYRSNLYS
ncbi:Arabinose operon regulatory protein [compost metagenome]